MKFNAKLVNAVGNHIRLEIIDCLFNNSTEMMAHLRTVGAIRERIGLSQSATSQHLAILREAGLVVTKKVKQTVYYSLAPKIVVLDFIEAIAKLDIVLRK